MAGSAMPPQMALMPMVMGYYVSRALWVAAKLCLADLVADGPRAAEQLGAVTGMHAPSLRRVLRLLVSVGVFVETDEGAFATNPLADCLRSGVPGSMRAATLLFAGGTQDVWAELLYSVRTGQPAFDHVRGMGGFEWFVAHPEEAAIFDEAMADFTTMIAMAVAGAVDFAGCHTIVDVGGGNGTLVAGILRVHPHLRGVVFDRPDVAPRAARRLEELGVADRASAVGGDFFMTVPEGGDAYLLKHVIHDWDDERATAILRACRRAMRRDARLLIVEGVYPPHVEVSPLCRSAASNDVNMLVCTGGRQRSEAEFHALFAAAGLAPGRIIPALPTVAVVEALPA